MPLLAPQVPVSTFMTLLYVPLGGSLPAAAGMLGPVLVVLFALLASSLVIFRRFVGQALTFLGQHWLWTLLTCAGLGLVSGALVLWWS